MPWLNFCTQVPIISAHRSLHSLDPYPWPAPASLLGESTPCLPTSPMGTRLWHPQYCCLVLKLCFFCFCPQLPRKEALAPSGTTEIFLPHTTPSVQMLHLFLHQGNSPLRNFPPVSFPRDFPTISFSQVLQKLESHLWLNLFVCFFSRIPGKQRDLAGHQFMCPWETVHN